MKEKPCFLKSTIFIAATLFATGIFAQCDNVTNGGSISGNQTGCGYYYSATIVNTALPTGGTGTLQYQWQSSPNGTSWNNISGATQQNYGPGYVFITTHYQRLSRRSGCTAYDGISNTVIKTVNPVPAPIVTPNGPTSFCSGGSVTLTANFSALVTYQWYWSSFPISGATTNSYVATVTGEFSVRETMISTGCSASSPSIHVSDDSQLSTTITEVGFSICNSSTILLQVQQGSGYTYEWYEDQNLLSNTNNYELAAGHDGNYSCTITNACGVFPSNLYPLTTYSFYSITEPAIISPSGSTTICSGGSVQLIVSHYYNGGISYQWYDGVTPISGANSSVYDATQGGNYSCLLTYSCWLTGSESTWTNWIEVTMGTGGYPTVSIAAGGSTTFCQGGSVLMTATATGGGITYQWYRNSGFISGATNAMHTATTDGAYVCIVTNSCGSETSNLIVVTVIPTSVTITSSVGMTQCSTNTIAMFATAAGTGGTYQWQLNGSGISGATSQSYTGAVQAGNYTCAITNSCGTFVSNALSYSILTNCATGLKFDGSNDYTQTTNHASYAFGTGNFTIEAWVNLNITQYSNFSTLYSQRTSGSLYSGIWIYFYNGRLNAQFAGYGLGNFGPDLRDNLCHHISITRTGPNAIHFYVDGNFVGTDVNTYSSVSATGPVYLGRDNYVSSSFYVGKIMELRMWNTGRTQGEIQSTMNSSLIGTETGLVGYWRLDDGAGQVINDLSVNNNDGQLGSLATVDSNDPVYSTSCPLSGCIPPPAIVTAGGSTTFCSGGTVTLNVNTGAGLTYQWRLNSSPVAGATNASLVVTAAGNYSCIVTNACGNSISNTIVVTVNSIPVASITASGSTTICSGSSVFLQATYNSTHTYQWQLNSANISGATNYYHYAGSQGSYQCIVSNVCGSSTSNTIALTVVNLPTANITAGGPTTFCTGGSVTLSANTGSGLSYQWRINSSGISGATHATYSANINGSYTCVVSNSCGSVSSNAISVTVTQLPTATITAGGSTFICSGGSVTLSANTGAGLSYQWRLNGGNISGATISTYSATGAGTFTCVVTNSCGSATSNAIVVTVVSVPTASITAGGPTTFCTGGSVILSANTGSGLSYQWRNNSNPISGATLSSYSVVSTGNFTCVVTNACGSATSNTVSVTVLALPVASISAGGSTTFCTGGSVLLTAGISAGATYQWRLNTSNISGATATTFTANAGGNYTCVLTNGCGSSTSNNIAVSVTSAPVASIGASGSTTICSGSSVTLSANTGTGYLYQWLLNSANISGATNSTYAATAPGSYTCVITNSCGNSTSNSITVTIIGPPTPTINALGPTTFCTGGSVNFNVTTAIQQTYQWRLNSSNIAGATLTAYTATAAGSYTCHVTNNCGNTVSNAIVVTVNGAPTAIITSGGTLLCAGNPILFSANTGTGLSYQWRLNGSAINGATSSTFNASSAGNYTCLVSHACGNTLSNTITLVQGPAVPNMPGPVSGLNKPCPGFTGIVYSISPVNGATAYSWTVPATASISGGQGTTSITVNFSTAYSGGTISVSASNICGTGNTRNKNITVGAHCLVNRAAAEEGNGLNVSLYPNPSNNHFKLKINSQGDSKMLLIIRDMVGKEVERMESMASDEFIFGSDLINGTYLAEIIVGNERRVMMVVKSE